MTHSEAANVTMIRAYLKALEDGATGEALRRFFTADAQQIELPNKLNPKGSTSDLAMLLQRAEQGQKLLRDQRYELKSAVGHGEHLAVEAAWSGTLVGPLGTIVAGTTLKAHFAMFFELSEGRIRVQRNYDSFEPW